MTSLTTALPLTNGIDNQICFSIIDYLVNTNVWTRQVFSNAQYAYIKDDLASKQRPSIYCYPVSSTKNSFSYSQTGRIILEIHFSFQKQRLDLAQNIIQISNLLQIINTRGDFTTHAKVTMPWLYWIGKECNVDYSQIYGKESVLKISLDYKVDLLAYNNMLQNIGNDLTSPDEQIYLAISGLLETVEVLNDDLEVVFTT